MTLCILKDLLNVDVLLMLIVVVNEKYFELQINIKLLIKVMILGEKNIFFP